MGHALRLDDSPGHRDSLPVQPGSGHRIPRVLHSLTAQLSLLVAVFVVFAGFHITIHYTNEKILYYLVSNRGGSEVTMGEKTWAEDVKEQIRAFQMFFFQKSVAISGVVTGTGAFAMHYIGMISMQMKASAEWSWGLIALSWLIAVISACVAFTTLLSLRGQRARMVSSLFLAVAVNGMHYVGMYAAKYYYNPDGFKGTVAPINVNLGALTALAAAALCIVIQGLGNFPMEERLKLLGAIAKLQNNNSELKDLKKLQANEIEHLKHSTDLMTLLPLSDASLVTFAADSVLRNFQKNASPLSWKPKDVKNILKNPLTRQLLKTYLNSKHSEETVDFCVKVLMFKRTKDIVAKRAMALDIYQSHVADSAPKQVNLPSKVFSLLSKQIENLENLSNFDDMFKDAYKACEELVFTNEVNDFFKAKSDILIALLDTAKERKRETKRDFEALLSTNQQLHNDTSDASASALDISGIKSSRGNSTSEIEQ